MLGDVEYRSFVTGNPPFIAHLVTNPGTGESFEFAGTADGFLLWTVDSLGGAVGEDGVWVRSSLEHCLGLAATQLAVAAGVPVRWVCQVRSDADALRALFADYGPELAKYAAGGSIDVVHLGTSVSGA